MSQSKTAKDILDEFMSSGAFDKLRKDVLASFRESDAHDVLGERVDEIALDTLEDANDPGARLSGLDPLVIAVMNDIDRFPLVDRAVSTISDSLRGENVRQMIDEAVAKLLSPPPDPDPTPPVPPPENGADLEPTPSSSSMGLVASDNTLEAEPPASASVIVVDGPHTNGLMSGPARTTVQKDESLEALEERISSDEAQPSPHGESVTQIDALVSPHSLTISRQTDMNLSSLRSEPISPVESNPAPQSSEHDPTAIRIVSDMGTSSLPFSSEQASPQLPSDSSGLAEPLGNLTAHPFSEELVDLHAGTITFEMDTASLSMADEQPTSPLHTSLDGIELANPPQEDKGGLLVSTQSPVPAIMPDWERLEGPTNAQSSPLSSLSDLTDISETRDVN